MGQFVLIIPEDIRSNFLFLPSFVALRLIVEAEVEKSSK